MTHGLRMGSNSVIDRYHVALATQQPCKNQNVRVVWGCWKNLMSADSVAKKKPARFEKVGRLRVSSVVEIDSEGNLASQLPESGFVRMPSLGRNFHPGNSCRRRFGGAIPCIVCPVEEIEYFKPELEIDSFCDTRVLVEVDIRLDEVWPAELHQPSRFRLDRTQERAKSLFGIAPVSQALLEVN